MDMWVGTRRAWQSKSLERHCQTAVRTFPGCYYTRCAFIRTDEGFTHAVQTEMKGTKVLTLGAGR